MARVKAQDDKLPGTVFSGRQVRILKIAVIAMGILLVGGFAFVLAAIVYQASRPKQDVAVTLPAANSGYRTDHRTAGGAGCRSHGDVS